MENVVDFARKVAQTDSEDDSALLTRFVERHDVSAFAVLLERYGHMVIAVCRRLLHNVQDAEDVFQATFLILATKAGSIRKRKSIASWLYGIAFRTACRFRRDAQRRRNHEKRAGELRSAWEPREEIDQDERRVLDAELNALPDKYRAPVLLCYFQGMTNAEAADALGWPKGTVAGRLSRARDLLRARLLRRGVGLSCPLGAMLVSMAGAKASMPAPLIYSTLQAIAVGAGQAAAVVATASTLAKGMLQTMFFTKLKIVLAVTLGFAALGVGVGVMSDHLSTTAHAAQPQKKSESAEQELARLRKENALLRKQIQNLRNQLLRALQAAQKERDQADKLRLIAEKAAKKATKALKNDEDAKRIEQTAQMKKSAKNLRHIGLAIHLYYDENARLPAQAIVDKNGKPLLSWRVKLLPYLDQQQLFNKFRLDEAWDSPHNKKLLAEMPDMFAPVTKTNEKYSTFYQVFHGQRTAFEGKQGRKFAEITDGTSNTIMVIEAAKPVPWTKPQDIQYAPGKKIPPVGGLFKNGFHILMCDGSTRFLPQTPTTEMFHRAIQVNDNKILNLDAP